MFTKKPFLWGNPCRLVSLREEILSPTLLDVPCYTRDLLNRRFDDIAIEVMQYRAKPSKAERMAILDFIGDPAEFVRKGIWLQSAYHALAIWLAADPNFKFRNISSTSASKLMTQLYSGTDLIKSKGHMERVVYALQAVTGCPLFLLVGDEYRCNPANLTADQMTSLEKFLRESLVEKAEIKITRDAEGICRDVRKSRESIQTRAELACTRAALGATTLASDPSALFKLTSKMIDFYSIALNCKDKQKEEKSQSEKTKSEQSEDESESESDESLDENLDENSIRIEDTAKQSDSGVEDEDADEGKIKDSDETMTRRANRDERNSIGMGESEERAVSQNKHQNGSNERAQKTDDSAKSTDEQRYIERKEERGHQDEKDDRMSQDISKESVEKQQATRVSTGCMDSTNPEGESQHTTSRNLNHSPTPTLENASSIGASTEPTFIDLTLDDDTAFESFEIDANQEIEFIKVEKKEAWEELNDKKSIANGFFDFKIYMENENEHQTVEEIRRFQMERKVANDYLLFRKKLETIFPNLEGKTSVLRWKDSDGDKITISSCDEMEAALSAMRGQKAMRFYLTVQDHMQVKLHSS